MNENLAAIAAEPAQRRYRCNIDIFLRVATTTDSRASGEEGTDTKLGKPTDAKIGEPTEVKPGEPTVIQPGELTTV